jgi:hypothetical protein
VRSVCEDANATEVRLPPAWSNVVGVADPIAVHRTLPTDIACAGHIHLVPSIADLPSVIAAALREPTNQEARKVASKQ